MKFAAIGPVSTHFPERVETNADLEAEFPNWPMEQLGAKTGIYQRYIAAPDETAADLGVKAAEKLFAENNIDRNDIDFLLFCTQSPDYPLPTTACLMQNELGLPTSTGALDFNLGCSGYVYGLAMADGLIRSGAAKNVLLVTSETYSRYIEPDDRSLRPIFSDAAAATLVYANDEPTLTGFKFGTDGAGADMLMVGKGGARESEKLTPRGRKRWGSLLYMHGAELMTFTVEAVPKLLREIFDETGLSAGEIDKYLFHQATYKMLAALQERLEVDTDKMPIEIAKVGNTVSATLPILIRQMRDEKRLQTGGNQLLVGFGVGLSWAGCVWKDAWGDAQ